MAVVSLAKPKKPITGNAICTIPVATRVLHVVDKGLSHGIGLNEPGKMCVEAAVCYALGMPHSDDPKCVGTAVRYLKIAFNDGLKWSLGENTSKEATKNRARALRKISVCQLGSNKIDQSRFLTLFHKYAIGNLYLVCEPKDELPSLTSYWAFKEKTPHSIVSLTAYMATMFPTKMKEFNKAAIDAACQALEELGCKGSKLWNRLPKKIREKKFKD